MKSQFAAAAPENKFGFVTPPASPDPEIWLIFFLLVFLAIFIAFLFLKNILAKAEKIRSSPERFRFWRNSLLTAAVCSILLGTLGLLISFYDTLIIVGISGVFSIDLAAGPIGEALVLAIMGVTNAFLAVVFFFFCQLKAIRIQQQ